MASIAGLARVMSRFRQAAALLMALGVGACAHSPGPGLDRREAQILSKAYVWRSETAPSTYTEDTLRSLFVAAADPLNDGARAEKFTRHLALALAVAGDARFSLQLARQPRDVQASVLRDISGLWQHHGLRYPATETLWRSVRK